jgi:hypothetical protein
MQNRKRRSFSLRTVLADVLAGERRLARELRHATLIERRPEVHRLPADEDELALEVCDLGEDRPDVYV